MISPGKSPSPLIQVNPQHLTITHGFVVPVFSHERGKEVFNQLPMAGALQRKKQTSARFGSPKAAFHDRCEFEWLSWDPFVEIFVCILKILKVSHICWIQTSRTQFIRTYYNYLGLQVQDVMVRIFCSWFKIQRYPVVSPSKCESLKTPWAL